MFLQRLPANVRAILASSSDPLDTLASMADKILEFSPSHSHAVYAVGSANASDDRFSRLEAQVAQISEALAELKFRGRESSQGGSRDHRPRSRTPKPKTSQSEIEICMYHKRYGVKARRCLLPCSFKPALCDTQAEN
ncbi:hypothetical protein GE061_019347 [Apolygus lucorum]|uniref:Uncharacterized protein n=1 Tax=Apolygus lucorum TaxID=248454 RepID=A0A8S9X7V5_APOLU|nr:hypothetical protein GE061_019347 [Apolygus lucorum]